MTQKGFALPLLLIILVLGMIAIIFFLSKTSVLKNQISEVIRPIQTPRVEVKTQYENPLDTKTQYTNPFASYKNPFDSIQ